MEAINKFNGVVCPLNRANIDTDQIIPKQFLKRIERQGFGQYVFHHWRFDDEGNKREDFIMNQTQYENAEILVAGENFGCGSSREHAPLAIKAAGVACVVAATFARIFYRNAINIGLPILECPEAVAGTEAGDELEIDFERGTIVNLTKGQVFQAQPFPEFMQKIMAAEGLINYIKTGR